MRAATKWFQKVTGKSMLKKLLWAESIDWRPIPTEFFDDLVADAIRYADKASSTAMIEGVPPPNRLAEFDRMLRVHAFVISTLLKGKRRGEIMQFATEQLQFAIEGELSKGASVARATARGKRTTANQFMGDAFGFAQINQNVDPFDMESQKRANEGVQNGSAWVFQESVLKKYGLLR